MVCACRGWSEVVALGHALAQPQIAPLRSLQPAFCCITTFFCLDQPAPGRNLLTVWMLGLSLGQTNSVAIPLPCPSLACCADPHALPEHHVFYALHCLLRFCEAGHVLKVCRAAWCVKGLSVLLLLLALWQRRCTPGAAGAWRSSTQVKLSWPVDFSS